MMTLYNRRNFLKTLAGIGLVLSADHSGFAGSSGSVVTTINTAGVNRPTNFDYYMVDMRQYGYANCFIGSGKEGNSLALTMLNDWWIPTREKIYPLAAEKYPDLINDSVRNLSAHPEDIERAFPKINKISLLIIYGQLNDPAFVSLRQLALSWSPYYLWTIAEMPKRVDYKNIGFSPADFETVIILDSSNNYYDLTSLLRLLYNIFMDRDSLIAIDLADVKWLFAGKFAKVFSHTTPYPYYYKGFNLFIKHHDAALRKADRVFFDVFADKSISLYDYNEMSSMVQNRLTDDAKMVISLFINHGFEGHMNSGLNLTLILPAV